MPKLGDVEKVVAIGSGPIATGQARDVVLVNFIPAIIATNPGMASRPHFEPLTHG